jgi:hypothetical protein
MLTTGMGSHSWVLSQRMKKIRAMLKKGSSQDSIEWARKGIEAGDYAPKCLQEPRRDTAGPEARVEAGIHQLSAHRPASQGGHRGECIHNTQALGANRYLF